MKAPFLSICIPSYNRTTELGNLLASIDCDPADIDVVICEDLAPKRLDVRAMVNAYAEASAYYINYQENSINLGYDGNLRRLVECARGEYIMFMGDDDLFVPGALARFIKLLKHKWNNIICQNL